MILDGILLFGGHTMKNSLCLSSGFIFHIFNKFKEGIFISFFFFISAFSITDVEILKESIKSFTGKPGFDIALSFIYDENTKERIVFKQNYSGHLFELEAALYSINILKDEILGFNLNIGVFNDIGFPSVELYLDNSLESILLIQTEFDIVSESCCIECKSGKRLKHNKNYKQFIKEINMIRLFRNIVAELRNKTIDIEIIGRKLKLNGMLSNHKDIYLSCNWIGLLDSSGFKITWHDIIHLVSKLQFKIILKHLVLSDLLKDTLEEYCFLNNENFIFDENISY